MIKYGNANEEILEGNNIKVLDGKSKTASEQPVFDKSKRRGHDELRRLQRLSDQES